ncbi:hypothetical protein [Streptomyces sp. NPDC056169]|uniref:hypothetical protein n=1 Tax=Streptomyces sp. NPDC056169 TaxID=3345734 RepID=UPI0035E2B762
MAYFSPKIEIKKIVNAALDEALPTWEANYEPGNVSDYLIGYANSEAAAKGAALAWLQSQSDIDLETVEWVEMPVGDQHDHWYDLIQNHADGIPTDTGINVRHRLPATVRDAARTVSGQQPEPTVADATAMLRRMAADAGLPVPAVGQPAEAQPADEAHPPHTGWVVEVYADDKWICVTGAFDTPQTAAQQRGRIKKRHPGKPTRIVRETVTRTVEDETR